MTSKELAKIIGVSQSTISRAMNGSPLISEARRTQILDMAEKYGFELNMNAKNLRTQSSSFIGIVMPTYFRDLISDDFRMLQFNYLYENLSRHDLDPVLLNNEEISSDASFLSRAVKKRQLSGLILSRRIEDDNVIKYLKSLSIPIISMTRCNEKMQFIPSVSSDSYEMGRLIGEHFVKGGHKNVALMRIQNHQSGKLTAKGFQEALMKGNINYSEKEDVFYTGFDFQSGYETVINNLERIRKYDAVFAQTDTIALGVLSALQDSGTSIPDDIAVAGNNDIPTARWFSPRLTTVRTFIDKQSQITCERIVSLIKSGIDPYKESHFVVKPELVVRESCP